MAMGGLFSALAVVIMLLGGMIGIGTMAAPLLAGVTTMVVMETCGSKTALVQWIASSVLGLILCPDKELAFLYLCFFGWYPVAKPAIEKSFPSRVAAVIKYVDFNCAIVLMYVFLMYLLFDGRWENAGFGGPGLTVMYLLAGNVIFALFDRLLNGIRMKVQKFKKH